MYTTTFWLVVRAGGGTKPGIIIAGEADGAVPYGGWVPEATACRIRHIERVPGTAGLSALHARAGELHRQMSAMVTNPRQSLDVTIDTTCEPMAVELLRDALPGAWLYNTVTGAVVDEPLFGLNRLGRAALLSELSVRMARGVVEVHVPPEPAEDFRKAFDQANLKPPKMEAEGMPLIDSDASDDMVMAAALGVWRAFRHPPTPKATSEAGSRWVKPLRRDMAGIC